LASSGSGLSPDTVPGAPPRAARQFYKVRTQGVGLGFQAGAVGWDGDDAFAACVICSIVALGRPPSLVW
jgi:hypothetical protein